MYYNSLYMWYNNSNNLIFTDPYVKVWLYFGEKRIEKKKSEVQFCTLNPEFHFSVMFDVPWERIRECQLNVTIMDHDKVGRNEAIGKIMLGERTRYKELGWN